MHENEGVGSAVVAAGTVELAVVLAVVAAVVVTGEASHTPHVRGHFSATIF